MIENNNTLYISNNHQCPKCKSYFTKEKPHIIEKLITLIFLIPFVITILGVIITFGNILFKKYI